MPRYVIALDEALGPDLEAVANRGGYPDTDAYLTALVTQQLTNDLVSYRSDALARAAQREVSKALSSATVTEDVAADVAPVEPALADAAPALAEPAP